MLTLIPRVITAVLLTASCAGFGQAFAQETTPSCATAVIYYSNGIQSTLNNRLIARSRIRVFLKPLLSPEEFDKIEFALAHNATGGNSATGFLRDLFESVQQDIQTDVSRFYRILSGIELMPEFFRAAALRVAINTDIDALIGNQDLQGHVNAYATDLAQGRKVLVVAHSQGNFFANQSWNSLHNLGSTQGFGIVSVANPDSFVGGGGPYTTLNEDLVIEGIRIAKEAAKFPQLPLEPNRSNGLTNGDPIGHNFLLAYTFFSSSNSSTKIFGDIVSTLNNPIPQVPSQGTPSSCASSIEIQTAVCSLDPASGQFVAALAGTASSELIGAKIAGAIPPVGTYPFGTQVSFCNGWTGIGLFNGLNYCERQTGDPIGTLWSTSYGVGLGITSVFVNLSSTTGATDEVPLTCPGHYP